MKTMLLISDDRESGNEFEIDNFHEDTDNCDRNADYFPEDGMAEEPDKLFQLLMHGIKK